MAFSTVFENTGSVRLRPSGDIVIKNMFGMKAGEIKVEGYNVLRNSVRGLSYNWGAKGFNFGRYTADITINPGYASSTINKMSVSFWIVPWQTITYFVVLILLGLYIIKSFFDKFDFVRRK